MVEDASEMLDSRQSRAYRGAVMLSMFVLWIVVFIGIFRGWRWTPILALATLGWTLVLLRFHMTSDIPLSF
jgi:hypothetical protein